MHRNLLQGSSITHYYSCIHHCSPFISIMQNHPSMLHRHSSFTQFIHAVHGLPLNLTPLTSDLAVLFTNQSSILSLCPNHLNTHCSAWPANSHKNTSSPLHLISHSVHTLLHTHSMRHLISITFNLFSTNAILYVSSPYSAIGSYSFKQPSLYIHSHPSFYKWTPFLHHWS